MSEFLLRSRPVLANLAMMLERSRHHEQNLNPSIRSIINELRRVEDQGVYNILCAIDVALWDQEFHAVRVPAMCDVPLSRAVADNRNYLVLHALDRTLATMANRARSYTK